MGLPRVAIAASLIALALSGVSPGSDLTLRSTTRLVEINVIAEDAQGHPITNLKKDDFWL
ncbi:MAG: hypothetical protein JO061_23940, partial [Acidobacteriaceae bacterium]|nr:hypothetical protein [Acidobacteriaceae bacterium]